MKKTIFLIILGLLTVGCIFYGTKRHFGNHVKLFDHGLINIELGDTDDSDTDRSDNKRNDFSQTLQSFSSIRIDTSVMEIILEEGSEFKAEGFYTKYWLEPTISVENNKLEIKQTKKKPSVTNGNQNCKVIVTLPAGTNLNFIDINSNVGEIQIRDIDAEKIDIDLNVGEIGVRNSAFEKLDIDNNVGEVNVRSKNKLDDYDISLATDVGQVNVNGRSHKRSYSQSGKGSKKIKVNTNVGEINIR